jgi:hypothetical protein
LMFFWILFFMATCGYCTHQPLAQTLDPLGST